MIRHVSKSLIIIESLLNIWQSEGLTKGDFVTMVIIIVLAKLSNMIANSIMHISRYSYQTWNVAWLYTCNFEKFHYYKQGQLRQTRINTRWTFLFI